MTPLAKKSDTYLQVQKLQDFHEHNKRKIT